MTDLSFAVITPSYQPDFERCRLLAWSVQQFITPPITHYIIVTRKDYPLFRTLQGPRTEILTVESLIPWWLFKLPIVKNGWMSLKTPPIRNWILQQIVKISAAYHINHDVLIYLDSDALFVRPFDVRQFVQGDKVRLFRAEIERPQEPTAWDKTAATLLGRPPHSLPNYMNGLITWRHDNAVKMYEHIQAVAQTDPIVALCRSQHLSEYYLYGSFVDDVLQSESGHFWTPYSPCKGYWGTEDLTDEQLARLFQTLEPEHAALMISAKAHISPDRYEHLIDTVPPVPSVFAEPEPEPRVLEELSQGGERQGAGA